MLSKAGMASMVGIEFWSLLKGSCKRYWRIYCSECALSFVNPNSVMLEICEMVVYVW